MHLFLLISLGTSLANDGKAVRGPAECQAVFVSPATEQCMLQGDWVATATGKNVEKAKEQALARLNSTMELVIPLQFQQASFEAQDRIRPLISGCISMAQTEAQIYCHGDSTLSNRESCYASFADESCWEGVGIELFDKPNWRAKESGRTDICNAVDDWMSKESMSAEKKLQCQLSCLQTAKVDCRTF